MKQCTHCKQWLPTEGTAGSFHRSRKNKDGFQNVCKQCNLARLNADNAEKRRHGLLTHSQRTRRRLRLEVLRHYGGEHPRCACPGCTEDHIEFLSIDHVAGGGHRHRKKIGEAGLYTWLKQHNFPDGFRVLCHNCNQALGAYGYCPHNTPGNYLTDIPRERDLQGDAVAQRIVDAVQQCTLQQLVATAANVAKLANMSVHTVRKYRRQLFLLGRWPYVKNYQNDQPHAVRH